VHRYLNANSAPASNFYPDAKRQKLDIEATETIDLTNEIILPKELNNENHQKHMHSQANSEILELSSRKCLEILTDLTEARELARLIADFTLQYCSEENFKEVMALLSKIPECELLNILNESDVEEKNLTKIKLINTYYPEDGKGGNFLVFAKFKSLTPIKVVSSTLEMKPLVSISSSKLPEGVEIF